MRWTANNAEGLLWQELRGRRLACHQFVRQHPIGPYFADFCCRKKKLVVELDGSQHADSTYDRRRDAFMRSLGYSVLRFWSHDVFKHRASVCETILAALDGRLAGDVTAFDLRFVFARGSDHAPDDSGSPGAIDPPVLTRWINIFHKSNPVTDPSS